MRDEHARRRPEFCPGIDLQLADGQIWSLPLPSGIDIEKRIGSESEKTAVTLMPHTYRAIVSAIFDPVGDGDIFRAKIALAIFLLNLNYTLTPNDLREILDDRGERWRREILSNSLNQLALAHLGSEDVTEGDTIEIQPDRILDLIRNKFRHEFSCTFRDFLHKSLRGKLLGRR